MSFFDLFRRNIRSYFLEFSPQKSSWLIVSWNFNLNQSYARQWSVEIHQQGTQNIQWNKNDDEEVLFSENQKLKCKRRVSGNRNEIRDLMNLSLHSTLKYGLEYHHEFLLAPVSGATAADYQNESKALLWLQASFGTLYRALDQFKDRSDLILTAAVFSGIEPESGNQVLRVIVFNLDIFCYFQQDQSLQMAVFDDKDLGHGGAKTPSFQQIIKVTKPQIYDEIVKLVHRMATLGEVP